jgi:hypothetical protein
MVFWRHALVLFLVFPFLALTLAMLTIAAITYTVAVSVPALRCFAITSPISAFVLSPVLLFPVGAAIYSRVFLFDPPLGSRAFWLRSSMAFSLLTVGCFFTASLANLAVRAVFQILPSWLHKIFGLRESALLQSAILVGGSLSVLVLLTVAGLCVYSIRDNSLVAFLCGAVGLGASAMCIRSLLRLAEPQVYQPNPIPAWSKRILFPHN